MVDKKLIAFSITIGAISILDVILAVTGHFFKALLIIFILFVITCGLVMDKKEVEE